MYTVALTWSAECVPALDCFGETANTFPGYIAINGRKKEARSFRHSINDPVSLFLVGKFIFIYEKRMA